MRAEFDDSDTTPLLTGVGVGVTKTVFSDCGSLTVIVATIVRIDGVRVAVTVAVASDAWVTVLVSFPAATEADEGEPPSTATTE